MSGQRKAPLGAAGNVGAPSRNRTRRPAANHAIALPLSYRGALGAGYPVPGRERIAPGVLLPNRQDQHADVVQIW